MIKIQGLPYLVPFILFLSFGLPGMGQPTLDPDLQQQKPKKYENRILRAEKTGEKKFTAPRRFFQNTYTHYNYVFNAETKLIQVLEAAKLQHIDRYSDLLSFYNYSLESTSAQKTELDSVIYKVNAGIFLHDLRSDWMDNLYLAMGQAYLFRNTLDSAYMTFQYMNYAFHPKDPDGYDQVIASNSTEGGNALKVSTAEKRNILDKAFSRPPSRNDALVWLIRTHLEREETGQAATLIQTLRNDPQFPERLHPRLDEMQAYYFYKLKQYDSAAVYLGEALPAAYNKQESARWEFLMGQLFKKAGSTEQAIDAFENASNHTLNPVMEVAAQLEIALLSGNSEGRNWKTVVQTLEKMARREKYASYRDLIYYTIGKLEYQNQAYTEAHQHLLKSIRYSLQNPEQKAQTWLLLGEVAFTQKQYQPAKAYYDSVENNQLAEAELPKLEQRKQVLSVVVAQMEIIERQDSLQALAAMPEAERMDILKKKLRQLRKQQAALENANAPAGNNFPGFNNAGNQPPADLFASGNSTEFYFYNNSLKSRGFNEFRNKWGNRPNSDNWRRSSSQSNPVFSKEKKGNQPDRTEETDEDTNLDQLLENIPLTPEKLQLSKDSVAQARYLIAVTLQNKLEDYAGAATEYEWLLENYPGGQLEADVLYNLAICYRMLGKQGELSVTTKRLNEKFPQSRQAQLAKDPLAVQAADSLQSRQATATYDQIYNQFLSGQFQQAVDAKRAADSSYGSHHWTPQLLYIESIYYIKQQNDSVAITVLEQLKRQFPEHALSEKVTTLIDVLRRRKEIESYLSNLEEKRQAEDSTRFQPIPVVKAPETPAPKEIKAAVPVQKTMVAPPKADSTRLKKEAPKLPEKPLFSRHAEQPHFVVIVLTNVDPVYVNETKNAFDRYHREKYYNQPMNVAVTSLSDTVKLVTIRGMANEAAALDYIERAKELAERDIIPWMKKENYYFMPVAEDNLNLLLDSTNLPAYRSFLQQVFPNLK